MAFNAIAIRLDEQMTTTDDLITQQINSTTKETAIFKNGADFQETPH